MSGAVPPPAPRSLRQAAGVPRPLCPGCGWSGRGDPARAPQRAPLRPALRTVGMPGGRPRGNAFRRCEGHLRSGASPPPTARPPGRAAGVPRPVCPGVVGAGVGTQHRPRSVRPCGRRCALWGWREGIPGGVPCAVVRGVGGQVLRLPRLSALRAGCRGPLPMCCGRGCAGEGEPRTVPLACMPCGGCVPRGWW